MMLKNKVENVPLSKKRPNPSQRLLNRNDVAAQSIRNKMMHLDNILVI